MKQETLNLISNIDENTVILPKSEGGAFEMYQMDTIADLRKTSRNFMRTEKILENIDAKTSTANETVAGIVTEARIKELSKALDPIQATETVAGIVKIATTSEVAAGVENTKAVTSKKLLNSFMYRRKLSESDDLNFVRETGYYSCENANYAIILKNYPALNLTGILEVTTVLDNSNNYYFINQKYRNTNTDRYWSRSWTIGVGWSSWRDEGALGVAYAQNGYIRNSDGTIFQWGWATENTSVVYFPVAFANLCAIVQITRCGGSGSSSGSGAPILGEATKTYFTMDSVVNSPDKSDVYWFSIGF